MKVFVAIIAAVVLMLTACVEENISYSPELRLSFSCDTLVFDTLFVGQPSATKTFMMYNRNKNALNIDEIRLGGGAASHFRVNVDGRIVDAGDAVNDIVIKGRDSLYVLVEMTPELSVGDSLFSFSFDSLLFHVNGNIQSVALLGVGRDANLINNLSITADTVLSSAKPYLVFGHIHIPENKSLTIAEGTHIYMHAGANIVADGTLTIAGTAQKPVVIRGDRTDAINDAAQTPYSQMPNQWGGIYLQNPSAHYVINNARIHGMSAGVMLIGSNRVSPSLSVSNTVIHNSGLYGVYAQMADLSLTNCEISNCGESCLLVVGGTTYMAHTTIANYYRFASRSTASLRIVNVSVQNGFARSYPVEAFVAENSIVFGQNANELEFVADSATTFNVYFSRSLIKSKQQDSHYFADCLWARSVNYPNAIDTVFRCVNIANIEETGYYNFRLDSLSFARNCAQQAVSSRYPLDLDAYHRLSDSAPDLGAYEFHSAN